MDASVNWHCQRRHYRVCRRMETSAETQLADGRLFCRISPPFTPPFSYKSLDLVVSHSAGWSRSWGGSVCVEVTIFFQSSKKNCFSLTLDAGRWPTLEERHRTASQSRTKSSWMKLTLWRYSRWWDWCGGLTVVPTVWSKELEEEINYSNAKLRSNTSHVVSTIKWMSYIKQNHS